MITNEAARTAQETSNAIPTARLAGWAITVHPTTNVMTAAVNVADPARFSDLAGMLSVPDGTEIAMIAARAAASGRYAQKINRQLAKSVTIPPITNPLAPAAAPAALQAAIARRRGRPSGVTVVSSFSAQGTDAAAAAPCRQRPAVSQMIEGAVAAAAAPAAKTARLARIVRR